MAETHEPKLTVWTIPQCLFVLAPYVLVAIAIGYWRESVFLGFCSLPPMLALFLQWPTYWKKRFGFD